MNNFYRTKARLWLQGGALILFMVMSSWTYSNQNLPFKKKTSIKYVGQVKGFPVQDFITYEYEYVPGGEFSLTQTLSREKYNPYDASYSHKGLIERDGNITFKAGYVLHPNDFKGIPGTTVDQTGGFFSYPPVLKEGMTFDDLEGLVTVTNNSDYSKVLDIKINKRRVIQKETLLVGTKNYEAFVIAYQVEIEKYFNNHWFESRNHDVKEWYVPNVGIIKKKENASVSVATQGSNDLRNYSTEFVMSAFKITQSAG